MRVGLYDSGNEHDACGVGMAVAIDGHRQHRIVEYGLELLENMAHRGAENGDGRTGDGAGIMVQVPHRFIERIGIPVPEAGRYGTGLVFLPKEGGDLFLTLFREECSRRALHVIEVREVPVDHTVPGEMALEREPRIVQVFVTSYDSPEVLERKLYRVRKVVSNRVNASDMEGKEDFYICSLSTRTMVYKGMLTPEQLRRYYPDLSAPDFESSVAMVHSRFSTNTLPAWRLAQPFRMLCHNGEINTIRSNRSWMAAREGMMSSEAFPDLSELRPIVQEGMSDSASLDNVFEFLTMSGRDMPGALSVLIPESWNDKNPIPDSLKAYYEYHSILMEPWDGPAAVLFTDGTLAGGMLDRNGLRPARYVVTEDNMLIMASEAGVIPTDRYRIVESGRLKPGKMLMVDTRVNRVLQDPEIKMSLASAYPYRDWLERNRLDLLTLSSGRQVGRTVADFEKKLAEFGYTDDDVSRVMEPMIATGKEAVGSAGYDAPLALLSDRPQHLFNYFRQRFAQVTNPPVDPIREELVMSITGYIGGARHNILDPEPMLAKVVKARHPVITNRELDLLRNLRYRGFKAVTIDTTFPEDGSLEDELDRVRAEAEAAVDDGAEFVVLSDRKAGGDRVPMPSLLSIAAVHRHLVDTDKRLMTALVVESGEPRNVMHFALLIGYGANAVNPYMALAVVQDLADKGKVKMDADTAEANYIKACDKGLMKIMSKMGISTIRSYRGSGLFEIIGLDKGLSHKVFGDTPSPVGGIGIDGIAAEYKRMHEDAKGVSGYGADRGEYTSRKDGERHSWSPEAVKLLRSAARTGDADEYRRFADIVDGGRFFLRDLMMFKGGRAVPLDEVETVESIMTRFKSAAISFGAISKEAHETLAEAMNAVGSESNSGEGGEDPARSFSYPDGRNARSKVRQIASGRFGVTAEYLVHADELQIKVAQGAKPGEGGQLMGFKVDRTIAAIRHTIPGITLISPPPHHDIYSIEDLKQLIHDLRCINPKAKISVKLVAEAGVGTVAAGVAKSGADIILISGGDGGTGASPLSSIRYAGSPWETGLAEVQQTLILNRLRGRVRLQADGQFKTARDVVAAAMLGAEDFGFATAPMVAMGCIMCRRCQTNTCPAGIATQDPERRKKFDSCSEDVIRYWRLMAEDVRRLLASLGLRSLDEAVGRADMLVPRAVEGKAASADLSSLLTVIEGERRCGAGQPDDPMSQVDTAMIRDCAPALESGKKVALSYRIGNTDLSVGVGLAGEIARSAKSLDDGTVDVTFVGTAGQSFGGFLPKGVTFRMKGLANDYVGKGLSGGIISVSPGPSAGDAVAAGNTILYGATSGQLYIAGSVGERFCVRNSGATAVAEGAGDHCCEYMTGGRVVVLGRCGRNFAAGMSAGIAYVLDEDGDFDRHCNMDMVELSLVENPADEAELKGIIENHLRETGSPKAAAILDDWVSYLPRFIKVMPVGYKLLLEQESE